MREPPRGLHPKTRDLLARIRARQLAAQAPDAPPVPYFPQGETPPAPCLACGGTEKNSRGGDCYPCKVRKYGS